MRRSLYFISGLLMTLSVAWAGSETWKVAYFHTVIAFALSMVADLMKRRKS